MNRWKIGRKNRTTHTPNVEAAELIYKLHVNNFKVLCQVILYIIKKVACIGIQLKNAYESMERHHIHNREGNVLP